MPRRSSRSRSPPPRRGADSRSRGKSGKGKKGSGKGGSQSILVRNLDYTSSPEEVKAHFASCGPIKDVYLPLEYQSRKPKGFGFVEFVNSDDAHYAVRSMNNTMLGGKELAVMIAQNRRKSPGTMQAIEGERGPPRDGDREWSRPREHWTKNLPSRYSRSRSRTPKKRNRSDRRDDSRKRGSERRDSERKNSERRSDRRAKSVSRGDSRRR